MARDSDFAAKEGFAKVAIASQLHVHIFEIAWLRWCDETTLVSTDDVCRASALIAVYNEASEQFVPLGAESCFLKQFALCGLHRVFAFFNMSRRQGKRHAARAMLVLAYADDLAVRRCCENEGEARHPHLEIIIDHAAVR